MEKLKAIQKELGESSGEKSEVEQIKEKIEKANMPEHIVQVAMKELERFDKGPQSSAESSVIRNYLDWLLSLPWTDRKSTRLNSSHVAISYAVFCLKKKN